MLEIAAPDVVYGVRALTASGHSEVLSWARSAPRRISDELRPDSGTHILDILSEVESAEPTIAAGTNSSTLDHVAHGAFADFNPSESWAFATSSGDSSVDSGTQQFNSRTLIHGTAKRCSFISTTNSAATRVLWVVDEPTVAELRWVWNLRALASISGGSVAIVELSDTRSEGFKAEVHRWVLSQPLQSEPSLIISSWSISKPLLVGLRSRLGLDAHKGGKIPQHFGRTGEPVLSAAVNWDPREILMGKTTAGTRVTLNTTLATPSSALHLENPLAFRRPGGRVRLRVTGPDFLDVPRRHPGCRSVRTERYVARRRPGVRNDTQQELPG